MNKRIAVLALAATVFFSPMARAHADASTALSTLSVLPLASVVATASVAAGASVAMPVALSAAGAVLVVKSVEVGVRSSLYVLERASDGATVSVEVLHHGAHRASHGVGTVVTVSVLASGVVLSAAGEAIAFVPNALGRALLHNEQLTR